ncbi:hypothetical protein [Microvirga guangxiensis]|uniref:Uncharacterized protein n=1 Tax=Microvirga guangxiensis TaxID=549386 RepID=A0A1G5ENQ1_9HYPH|nr:hypothetical protein [Microvirga guangxiensis]SCY28544.1 hypothetical protein SAMN02927923_01053 [Microvirga guangxiensis]
MQEKGDHWSGLIGGYRIPYDPRPALQAIEQGKAELAWEELWENLYHQGDVGSASYAAVPEIVRIIAHTEKPDWNTYALISTIEEARLSEHNPPVPEWLEPAYQEAWKRVPELALVHLAPASDETLICSILAALAQAKGQTTLGKLALLTERELQEIIADYS